MDASISIFAYGSFIFFITTVKRVYYEWERFNE